MDSPKDVNSAKMCLLDMQQACRVCLSKENNMNMMDLAYENECMLDIFTRCTTISLMPNEGLSTYLCGKCIKFLMEVQDFKLKALKSNSKLLYMKEIAEKPVQIQLPDPIEIEDDEVEEAKSDENEENSSDHVQEKTIYATLQNVVPNFVVATSFENNVVHTTNAESMCLVYEDEENYYLDNGQSMANSQGMDKENIVLKFESEEVPTVKNPLEIEEEVCEREKTKNDVKKMQIVQVCKICRQVFTTVRELNKHFNSFHRRDLPLLKQEQI